jgi:uncharacterized protein
MSYLHVIQEEVRRRVENIAATEKQWPCRKGCDDCCRHLASVPIVTKEEWEQMAAALNELPVETARQLRQRIRDSAGLTRPVVCPLLDTVAGTCFVYRARPVACRAYGFYAERETVLGCSRIERIAEQENDVIWGNHAALEAKLRALGSGAELHQWLASEES